MFSWRARPLKQPCAFFANFLQQKNRMQIPRKGGVLSRPVEGENSPLGVSKNMRQPSASNAASMYSARIARKTAKNRVSAEFLTDRSIAHGAGAKSLEYRAGGSRFNTGSKETA